MDLYRKKSKDMIFNFTRDYHFTSKTTMGNDVNDIIKETKILDVVVADDLNWDSIGVPLCYIYSGTALPGIA